MYEIFRVAIKIDWHTFQNSFYTQWNKIILLIKIWEEKDKNHFQSNNKIIYDVPF